MGEYAFEQVAHHQDQEHVVARLLLARVISHGPILVAFALVEPRRVTEGQRQELEQYSARQYEALQVGRREAAFAETRDKKCQC